MRIHPTTASLFQVANPILLINKRRDVYGLERERWDIILKNFKKEDK